MHLHGLALPAPARDILGDALWAALIFWLVSLAAPRAAVGWRTPTALGVCFAVEFSQLISADWLTSVRATSLGHLFLGSSFDLRDLAAYAGGVAVAAVLDTLLTSPVFVG